MALQVDSQDQVQEVLGILSRRRWAIVLPAAYIITLGVVIAVFVPKRYVAEMTINLLEARVDDRSYDRRSLQESATQREIENAEYQAKSYTRVRQVVEDLNWLDYLELSPADRHDYILRLRERIDVDVAEKTGDEGSTFVDVSYSDVDRERSEEFLDRLTTLWVTEVYQRDAENLREERATFRRLRDEARKEFERLERERAQLITDSGLTPAQVDGSSRGRDEDPVQEALTERRAEVEDLETDIEELSAAMASLSDLIDATPRDIVSAVEGTTDYDAQIKKIETQMQALLVQQDRYYSTNTEWQRLQDQLDVLEDQIGALRDAAKQVTVTSTPEPNPDRIERQRRYDEMKLELDRLVARRDRLVALNEEDERELELRINALSRVRELDAEIEGRRANLQDAEGQLFEREQSLAVLQEAYGQPWIVTQEATAGRRPTEPNVAILVAFAVILGLGVGVGSAAAGEFLTSGFRTAGDAARGLDLPVLGVVGEFRSRAERRAGVLRQTVLLLSTLLIIGGIGWFTWAWANRPELLSEGVLQAIEDVRRNFQ